MADPYVVCWLLPLNYETHKIFRDAHNAEFYRQGTLNDRSCDEPNTRRAATLEAPQDEDVDDRLELLLNKPPKYRGAGWCLGSSLQSDIWIGSALRGYSHRSLRIQYRPDGSGRLELVVSSRRMVTINYGEQDDEDIERNLLNFILFPEKRSIDVTVGDTFSFSILLPKYGNNLNAHSALRKTFIDQTPPIDMVLDLATRPQTALASMLTTARTQPAHTPVEYLGKGRGSRVYKVKDASTGNIYACKEYLPTYRPLATILPELIRFERLSVHDHIARYVRRTMENSRLRILIEFFPLGNLEHQHRQQKVGIGAAIGVVYQTAKAVAFLHENQIIHRNIRPSNILVSSRGPIVVKITDFGLPDVGHGQPASRGTLQWSAPEAFSDTFTGAVDMWTIGPLFLFLRDLLIDRGLNPLQPSAWYHQVRQLVTFELNGHSIVNISDSDRNVYMGMMQVLSRFLMLLDPCLRCSAKRLMGQTILVLNKEKHRISQTALPINHDSNNARPHGAGPFAVNDRPTGAHQPHQPSGHSTASSGTMNTPSQAIQQSAIPQAHLPVMPWQQGGAYRAREQSLPSSAVTEIAAWPSGQNHVAGIGPIGKGVPIAPKQPWMQVPAAQRVPPEMTREMRLYREAQRLQAEWYPGGQQGARESRRTAATIVNQSNTSDRPQSNDVNSMSSHLKESSRKRLCDRDTADGHGVEDQHLTARMKRPRMEQSRLDMLLSATEYVECTAGTAMATPSSAAPTQPLAPPASTKKAQEDANPLEGDTEDDSPIQQRMES